jgi:hypothetical protein
MPDNVICDVSTISGSGNSQVGSCFQTRPKISNLIGIVSLRTSIATSILFSGRHFVATGRGAGIADSLNFRCRNTSFGDLADLVKVDEVHGRLAMSDGGVAPSFLWQGKDSHAGIILENSFGRWRDWHRQPGHT